MGELVQLARADDIAVITIDNPPVNALSPGVPEGLRSSMEAAAQDPAGKAVVVIGADSTFIAGADIREFGKMTSGERPRIALHPKLSTVEDSPKPGVKTNPGQSFGRTPGLD